MLAILLGNKNTMSMSSLQIYKRLLKAAAPYWWAFLLGILGNALIAASDGCLTYYFKPLLEKGFIERDPIFIYWIPFVIIGFFLARGTAYFLANYFMSWVGRSVVRDFRTKMVAHLMKLPACYFDNKTTGELLSKINYDTDQVAEAISEAITSTIRGVLTTFAMVIVMYELNSRITLILLIAVPFLAIYINKISRRMRSHSGEIQITMGKVTHVAGEVIGGYKVIKNFGGMAYENERFAKASNANWLQEMKMSATSSFSVSGMQFIGVCALAVFLFLATLEPGHSLGHLLGTSMSAGSFISMATAILGLLRPIKQVAVVNSTLQRGIAGARSIFALLDEVPEKNIGIKHTERARGEVIFKDVYFEYKASEDKQIDLSTTIDLSALSATDKICNNVLKGINIEIKPGETVALVGRSGSGKSTLASLLPRFYDCQRGKITLDGTDIREFELSDLRRQFALVTQQVTLFNDTIANNIAYGDMRDASFESIRRAAELSYALEFIEKLPDGFNTEIGENGVRLSGGQRQRLAIARAILKDAPVLILDEATSALDSQSEQYIQAALETLMKDRTTLVIAHRLSTIERAHKVLVLENGSIIENGTHLELIQGNGRYAALQRADVHEGEWELEV
jgi:subfamily B ATP-binding cassette protein MsbA